MSLEIGNRISDEKIRSCEHVTTFGIYQIYLLNEDPAYVFAVDANLIVSSCFEFVWTEDGLQLAHMHTLDHLKGNGIGRQILNEAVRMWDVFLLPSTDSSQPYYFVEDGLQWIRRRFDDGILTEPPFARP